MPRATYTERRPIMDAIKAAEAENAEKRSQLADADLERAWLEALNDHGRELDTRLAEEDDHMGYDTLEEKRGER